jgi:hypothetical protein
VIIAAAAALLAACCYALSAALEHHAVGREPVSHTLDPRLLGRLARRPMWMAGIGADTAATVLQGVALATGPLALVQPLLVLGLVVAVPLEAVIDKRSPGRRDIAGVCAASVGLATFVIVADPRPGPVSPAHADLVLPVVGAGLVMALLVLLGTRTTGAVKATALGVAAGAGFALVAALAKACLDVIAKEGFAAVLIDWRLWALAAAGLAALVLNQNAYQAGGLAGPLTGLALTDALGSILIAVMAFGEEVRASAVAIAIQVVALVVMGVGVWLVSQAGTSAPRGPSHRRFRLRRPRIGAGSRSD